MTFVEYEKQLNSIINDTNITEDYKKVAEADLAVIQKYKENNSPLLKAYLENVIKSEEKHNG